jgi:hypothetical protein
MSNTATNVTVIVGCLPATRPLFSHYTPTWIKDMVHKSISYVSSSVASAATRSHNTKNAQSQHTTGGGGVSLASGKWVAQKSFSSSQQTTTTTTGANSTTTGTAHSGASSIHSGALENDPDFHDGDDDFGAADDDDQIALQPYPKTKNPSHKHTNNPSVGSIVVTREVMLHTEEREDLEGQQVQREDWARHGN